MKVKLEEKEKAREFRRQGKSIVEIEKLIGCPRSSVSNWCKDVVLSEEQLQNLRFNSKNPLEKNRLTISENKKKERVKRQFFHQQRAVNDIESIIGKISKRDLWLLGTSLYWAEGWKTGRGICFTNSDPLMIDVFMNFLLECIKVPFDKISYQLQVWSDLNKDEVLEFWSKLLKCPKEQIRTYVRQAKHNKTVKLKYGIFQLYAGANEFYYLEGLLDGLKRMTQDSINI